MYHYVYCIENLVNGKVYVGKHSTNDVNDGYMGSGKLLNAAIKKYGIENFRKHILMTFESSDEAFEFERQLVNENFVADENTYNIRVGGEGGRVPNWSDPEWRAKKIESVKEHNRRLHVEGVLVAPDWTGKRHTEETKKKIGSANSLRQSGSGNSHFGKVWVSHNELKTSRRIRKEELDAFLDLGWIKGRKMKWNMHE